MYILETSRKRNLTRVRMCLCMNMSLRTECWYTNISQIVSVGLLALIILSTHLSLALGTGCTIALYRLKYPDQVGVDQSFELQTQVTVNCGFAGYWYTLRLDLADTRSGQILSETTSTWSPLPNEASHVYGWLINTATAPSTRGYWRLQLDVTIIDQTSSQVQILVKVV